jgi:RNA polymerase sigma factor (sigma-70 family)
MTSENTTVQLQGLIDRLHGGDGEARRCLLERACDRLRRLTRTIFADFARLRRHEESGDILNNAVIRLMRRLSGEQPATVRDFFRLAAREIRCTLLDMVRHHFGPECAGVREVGTPVSPEASVGAGEPSATTYEPAALAIWTEFHEKVEQLPDEVREVVDLLWYEGLSQTEAAEVLGVAAITVKRRWAEARLRLGAALQ